jgi:hypothetical protein
MEERVSILTVSFIISKHFFRQQKTNGQVLSNSTWRTHLLMIGDENIDVVELPTMWKAMQKRFLSPGKKWWEQFIGCS